MLFDADFPKYRRVKLACQVFEGFGGRLGVMPGNKVGRAFAVPQSRRSADVAAAGLGSRCGETRGQAR
ncbi:MAG TPA: hypothetical protein VNL15_03525, partial [Dehalococcoidia bacterium]|nr:hypothetical protein [Dehalococcoidia bacterium]